MQGVLLVALCAFALAQGGTAWTERPLIGMLCCERCCVRAGERGGMAWTERVQRGAARWER